MKREDLIKRLEDAEPPQAELPGCQQRLKTALLQEKYSAWDKSSGITGWLWDTAVCKRKAWQTTEATTHLYAPRIAAVGR